MMKVTCDLFHQIQPSNISSQSHTIEVIFNSLVQTYYIKLYHAGINIGFLISTYVPDCQKFYISINFCSIVSFEQNNYFCDTNLQLYNNIMVPS